MDFPETPRSGDFLIDFTHEMDADPQSANQKRWVERLDHIAKTYGAQGDNSMWSASSDEVFNYSLASHAAQAAIKGGFLTVHLPDAVPGSALTIKIHGLAPHIALTPPAGAVLYQRGDTAWLTTPMIGKPGAPPVSPRVHRIYAGEVKNLTWDQPVKIAGVRFRQFGPGTKDFVLKLEIVTPSGITQSLLPGGQTKLGEVWGGWPLYPTIPDRPAPLAKELHVTPDRDLKEMEVWAVSE